MVSLNCTFDNNSCAVHWDAGKEQKQHNYVFISSHPVYVNSKKIAEHKRCFLNWMLLTTMYCWVQRLGVLSFYYSVESMSPLKENPDYYYYFFFWNNLRSPCTATLVIISCGLIEKSSGAVMGVISLTSISSGSDPWGMKNDFPLISKILLLSRSKLITKLVKWKE